MLVNKKIDATGLPYPFALMSENQGMNILTSNDKLGFAITGIMFRSESLNNKSEQIKKCTLPTTKASNT